MEMGIPGQVGHPDIAKAYESDDGQTVIITDDDADLDTTSVAGAGAATGVAGFAAGSQLEDEDASDDEPQVTVVPEGTPDTGAEGTPLAPFAAGALALAAVAGTGVALRRRQA